MNRHALLLTFALLLASAYAYFFTDWFHPPRIQISLQPRPMWSGQPTLPFRLDGKYRLTDVKVVPLGALGTNRSAVPVWHLVKGTNAPATSYVIYGNPVDGLKPAEDKPQPEPLEPNTGYRLSIEAGRAKGELDFRTPPAAGE